MIAFCAEERHGEWSVCAYPHGPIVAGPCRTGDEAHELARLMTENQRALELAEEALASCKAMDKEQQARLAERRFKGNEELQALTDELYQQLWDEPEETSGFRP